MAKRLHHNPCMMTLSRSKLATAAVTLVVWSVALASLGYWLLKIAFVPAAPASVPVAAAAPVATDAVAVSRLLGSVAPVAQSVQVSLASRFSLIGVIAGAPGGGAALIAVDGQPAKPFRVGSAVDQNLMLQSATGRQARLAESRDGPAALVLELPPLRN